MKCRLSLNSGRSVPFKITLAISHFIGRGGVVVERRTPKREVQVLGSIPTGVTVMCP